MHVLRDLVVALTALVMAAVSARPISCPDCEVVTRDVAVIGGGSSGCFTAVRLRDQNYSVAVIEPKTHLGGNAETYTASNGWTIDIGVIVFSRQDTIKNYFDRFNVSLVPLPSSGGGGSVPTFMDYSTGKYVEDVEVPSNDAIAQGFANYAAQLAKYPYLVNGFNLTYPIAADSDLLLPFGQFADKYNMSAAMQTIFVTNQGYAPLLQIPTLYMLKYLNAEQLNSMAQGFMTTANHDIQALYRNVGAFLNDGDIDNANGADNVFLNSTVLATDRSVSPAQVLIQTPRGRKLVVAKKLVVTAPPLLTTVQHAVTDLTPTETTLFAQFFANGYYTGVLSNTSFPANFSAQALTEPSAGVSYNLPTLPGLYSANVNSGAPDLLQVYYGSPTVLPASQVQLAIESAVQTIQRTQNFSSSSSSSSSSYTTPQWEIFSAHTPFNLMVTPAAIQDGFYRKVNALQGTSATFWNGAAWQTQDSSSLWVFTDEVVVPMVVDALKRYGK